MSGAPQNFKLAIQHIRKPTTIGRRARQQNTISRTGRRGTIPPIHGQGSFEVWESGAPWQTWGAKFSSPFERVFTSLACSTHCFLHCHIWAHRRGTRRRGNCGLLQPQTRGLNGRLAFTSRVGASSYFVHSWHWGGRRWRLLRSPKGNLRLPGDCKTPQGEIRLSREYADVEDFDPGQGTKILAWTYLGDQIWKTKEEWHASAPFVDHWILARKNGKKSILVDELNWWPLTLALKCRHILKDEAQLAGTDSPTLPCTRLVCSKPSARPKRTAFRFV